MSKQFSIFTSHCLWIDCLRMLSKWMASRRISGFLLAVSVFRRCVCVCVCVHICKNGCASTHMCVWISIPISMRVSWQNFQTIWKHFIGVIVVIVASRSLYSRFMSFPFASPSEKSFCWCWCCFRFSWIHTFIWQHIICCSIIVCSSCRHGLDSHFLRQTNGFFSLALSTSIQIYSILWYCFRDGMQTFRSSSSFLAYNQKIEFIIKHSSQKGQIERLCFSFASILLH